MDTSDNVYDYSPSQQIWALSMFANLVGRQSGSEKELQRAMEEKLPPKLKQLGQDSDWKVVWGPKVLNGNGISAQHPLNVWYVVSSAKQKRCVIAVAGTAPANIKTWININFAVGTVVDFNKWVSTWKAAFDKNKPIFFPSEPPVPGKPFCSSGTSIAVNNLLNYSPPSSAQAPGTRLHEYLKTVPRDHNVIFTGHSMGGAVTPTIALGLIQSGAVGLSRDRVQVYASAGATPGNKPFSDIFKGLGTNVYNPNDVVPMAWAVEVPEEQRIRNITEKIFKGATGPAKRMLDWAVNEALKRVKASGLDYFPVDSRAIKSQSVNQPSTWEELRDEMHRQHVTIHLQDWGIEDLVRDFEKSLHEVLGEPEYPNISDEPGEPRTRTLIDGTEWECIYNEESPKQVSD